MAVFTSSEFAIVCAARFASGSETAPLAVMATSFVAPSPPRTMARASEPQTSRSAATNAG